MKRKPFWQNIKFKYKLTIVNENTLEEVVGLHVSKLNGLSVLLVVFTVLFAIAALIVSFTPLRNYLPGYMNSEVRKQIVDNALLADSLSRLLERQNLYVMNLQDIIRGEVRLDSVRSIDSLTVQRSEELMERTENEERFRKEFEEQEKYNLANVKAPMPVSDIIFYRPALGMLSKGFRSGRTPLRSGHCGRCQRECVGHAGRHGHLLWIYAGKRLCDFIAACDQSGLRLQALRLVAQVSG